MFDWLLASTITTSMFVVALWLMTRYFQRQTEIAYQGLHANIQQLANEPIRRSHVDTKENRPVLVVTLHVRTGVPHEQLAVDVAQFCQAISDYDRTLGGQGLKLQPERCVNVPHQLQLRFQSEGDTNTENRMEQVRQVLLDWKGTNIPSTTTWTIPITLLGSNSPFDSCTATVAFVV